MSETVKLVINGSQVEVPKGTLVVNAARRVGHTIPVFCYHERMEPVGMCRMCLARVGSYARDQDGDLQRDVQGQPVINWMPKLQTACTLPVQEGMVVQTEVPEVHDGWRATLEFLLSSHPLDCPVCDKGGECPLQDLTWRHGPGLSSFHYEDKYRFRKPIPLGPAIWLDRERCVYCARCTRFSEEVAGDPVIGFEDRGRGQEIVSYSEPGFDSKFSGNTSDICPVGALTTEDFRFKARPWELEDHASLCPHCPVGCNTVLGTRAGRLQRIMPRENRQTNDLWICDKGRFAHHFLELEGRLTEPLIRRDGALVPARWPEALEHVAEGLRAFEPAQVAGWASDRLANEDLFLFRRLFQTLDSPHFDYREPGEDDDEEVELVGFLGAGRGTSLAQLPSSAAVFVLGADVEEEAPVHLLSLRQAARRGAKILTAGLRRTKLDRSAAQAVVHRPGAELALLGGLLNLVARRVSPQVKGWPKLAQEAAAYAPERVARVSGVSVEALEGLAGALVEAESVLFLWGRQARAAGRGAEVARLLAALAVATGQYGRPNAGLLPILRRANSQGARDLRARGQGLDAAGLLAGLGEAIRAVYLLGRDPVGEGRLTADQLRKAELVVVQDIVMTASAEQADVVLPAAAWAERGGSYTNMERRVQRFHAGLPAPGSARPDWEILVGLVQALGGEAEYLVEGEVWRAIQGAVPAYAELGLEGLGPAEARVSRRYDHYVMNGTSYHQAEAVGLQSPTRIERGERPPRLSLPPFEAQALAEGLWLVGDKRLYDDGALFRPTEVLRPFTTTAHVELSAQDAGRLGVADGDAVTVRSEQGQLSLRATVNGRAPVGVALLPEFFHGAEGWRVFAPGASAAPVTVEKA